MRGTAPLARVVALVALAAAIAIIAMLLLGGAGEGYEVKARFQNASQLVKGNLVQVGGIRVGRVTELHPEEPVEGDAQHRAHAVVEHAV